MPHPLLSKGADFNYLKFVIPTEVEGPLFDFETWLGRWVTESQVILALLGWPILRFLKGWRFSLLLLSLLFNNSQNQSPVARGHEIGDEEPFGCRTLCYLRVRILILLFSFSSTIDRNQSFPIPFIKAPTAPQPISWMLHQLPIHWVPVHVFQLLFQLLFAPNIEIVESSLPKRL